MEQTGIYDKILIWRREKEREHEREHEREQWQRRINLGNAVVSWILQLG
jgi:hypothetical protein